MVIKNDLKVLIEAVREKRQSQGYSLRRLAEITGVSFATLSRLERLEGEPDNNTRIRLLNWLGDDSEALGLMRELIADVHFNVAKNIDSKTVESLIAVANLAKKDFS